MKTCICGTGTISGVTESEFKAQYNDHKQSFTYCVDEKATNCSNTFRT